MRDRHMQTAHTTCAHLPPAAPALMKIDMMLRGSRDIGFRLELMDMINEKMKEIMRERWLDAQQRQNGMGAGAESDSGERSAAVSAH